MISHGSPQSVYRTLRPIFPVPVVTAVVVTDPGTPQTAVQQQPSAPAAQTASSLLKPPDTIPQSQALG